MSRLRKKKTIKQTKINSAVFSLSTVVFFVVLAMLAKPTKFVLIKIAQAADGFAVGSNALIMNSGENLFYGNFSASSNAAASPILLQKPAGTNIFRVDTSGSIVMSGSLTLPTTSSITLGTSYGSGLLTFWNGATSYTIFDIANSRLENKLGKFYTSGGVGYFGTLDNNSLALMVANAERMRFNTAGNVGIAKTGPGATLDIVGGVNSTGTVNGAGLCIASDCKASWSALVAAGGGNYWSKTSGYIYPTTITDNVGVGVTNPGYKLDVAYTQTNDAGLGTADGLSVRNNSAGGIRLGSISGTNTGTISSNGATSPIAFFTNNGSTWGERVRLGATGYLGIGTTAPDLALTSQKDNGSGWAALFRTSPSYAGLLVGSQSANYLRLGAYDSTLTAVRNLALNSAGGNVGIAKTNLLTTLDIVGGITATSSVATSSINGTGLCIAGTCRMRWPDGSNSQWVDLAGGIYYSLGNVGIKTSNPRSFLEVTASSTTASVPAPGTTQTYTNNSTGNTGTIYSWTVPATATYTIDAYGAQGGTPTSYTTYIGGKGARMKGDFALTAGDVIRILVGQQGLGTTYSGGGGGGTFVVKQAGNVPLVVAGGGGGSSYSGGSAYGMDAVTTTSGTNDRSGNCGGGSSGNAGSCCSSYAHSGAGFTGNGGTCQIGGTAALSFTNGGTGSSYSSSQGGFGGGGADYYNSGYGGGGGGGYSGGAAAYSSNTYGGGGGGSYNSGTNQTNTAGINTGHGKVFITSPGVGTVLVTLQGEAAKFTGYSNVAGVVQIGNPGSDCTSQNEGMIKYSTTTKSFSGCDGMGWQDFIAQ